MKCGEEIAWELTVEEGTAQCVAGCHYGVAWELSWYGLSKYGLVNALSREMLRERRYL
jgi:hypothetical protein